MNDWNLLQIIAVVFISFIVVYIAARLISHAYFRAREEFIKRTEGE